MPASPQETLLRIDRDEVIPTIDIDIGQAQFGSYVIGLWNRHGRAFMIGSGDTDDAAPTHSVAHTYRIVRTRDQLAQLNGFRISVVVSIQSFRMTPGARWSYEWTIRQGADVLDHVASNGAVTRQLLTGSRIYRIELV